MKVSEYRELIDAVFSAISSVKSAATPNERLLESKRLKWWFGLLKSADCKHSKIRDQTRASQAIIAANNILSSKGE